MKNYRFLVLGLGLSLSLAILFASCEKTSTAVNEEIANGELKTDTGSNTCDETLIYMREEEKLAHDVYVTMYKNYNIPVFNHISRSELYHSNAIKGLLDYYNLEDPYVEGVGNFTNPDLAGLYTELVESGNTDLESALRVGATIEEIDIIDLQEAIENCSEDTVNVVYTRLLLASGNHLRAFVGQLEFRGFEYEPQFLSIEEFEEIINGEHQTGNGGCDSTLADLTEFEEESLLFMREEEKLAHDVYVHFFNLWGARVFDNISKSEWAHTSQILILLNTYELDDPASEEAGVFNNTDLQELYNQLIAIGEESLQQALFVGATVEEVDIMDLWESLEQTENPSITRTYTNLERASEAHLRAFVGVLALQGVTYEPQYISQEEFDRIMNN